MRVPFMLVFHRNKCIGAIKCILFYYHHTFISMICDACLSLDVACGSEDVIQYSCHIITSASQSWGFLWLYVEWWITPKSTRRQSMSLHFFQSKFPQTWFRL